MRIMNEFPQTSVRLASEFPAADHAAWRRLVEGVLKGADFDKTLLRPSPDGLAIQALSQRRADAGLIAGARGNSPWGVVATLDHPDPHEANRLALADLEGGADQITLAFAGARSARGFGLRDAREATLRLALAGIHCDLVTIRLDAAPFADLATAESLARLLQATGLPPGSLKLDFGLKPLADWAITGQLPGTWASVTASIHAGIGALQEAGFNSPILCADSRPFHEAGASNALELAILLAQGVSYLRLLQEADINPEAAQSLISFSMTVDQEQFASIAKLRALRRLWAGALGACGARLVPATIHAETSFRMMTRRDPQVNMLRATIAALAAGLGGADSLSILAHSAALGLPDEAARRLARNTSLILLREANLARVVDPGAGSGSLEDLTDALSETAWSLFQQIEAERSGDLVGMPAALSSGALARQIRASREAFQRAIATRRIPLTGVSEFPDLHEADSPVLLPMPKSRSESSDFPSFRFAEPFEALRVRAEAMAEAGKPPRIFLAPLGSLADLTPRATFTRNVYEAGGVSAIVPDGFARPDGGTNREDLLAAFRAGGTSAVCLVGTDADYAAEAVVMAEELRAAGAQVLHLAGRPGNLEPALRAAGLSAFLFAGMDLVQHLDATLQSIAAANGRGERS
ncbi:Sbm Methylmalonyl-CoA mutase, N-terminal domain/subunit [Rhabdaerophilaceae bacterium]